MIDHDTNLVDHVITLSNQIGQPRNHFQIESVLYFLNVAHLIETNETLFIEPMVKNAHSAILDRIEPYYIGLGDQNITQPIPIVTKDSHDQFKIETYRPDHIVKVDDQFIRRSLPRILNVDPNQIDAYMKNDPQFQQMSLGQQFDATITKSFYQNKFDQYFPSQPPIKPSDHLTLKQFKQLANQYLKQQIAPDADQKQNIDTELHLLTIAPIKKNYRAVYYCNLNHHYYQVIYGHTAKKITINTFSFTGKRDYPIDRGAFQ